MWASDVSEKGFQYLKGFAVVPVEKKNENLSGTELARWVKLSKSEKEGELYKFEEPEEEQYIDQKLRQEAFDNYETTDDHGMVFVGTAVDQNGTKYYKVKNSWGTEQIYGGFFYASEAFVKYKTMDILVHKDAVPVKILDVYKRQAYNLKSVTILSNFLKSIFPSICSGFLFAPVIS